MSTQWDLIGDGTFKSIVILGDSESEVSCHVSWAIFGSAVMSGDYASTKVEYTVVHGDTNIHGQLPIETNFASVILSDSERAKGILESVIGNGSRLPKMHFESQFDTNQQ